MKSNERPSKILILHDIRSAQNVGSLLRTADAIGIDRVYLSSMTAHPIDRFGRPHTAIAKTALGAEHNIAWEPYDDICELIQDLKNNGVRIIAIEQSTRAFDYKTISPQLPTAFILGNEIGGISEDVLERVDTIVMIPMRGIKESLNVSVAGGIALFRLLDI